MRRLYLQLVFLALMACDSPSPTSLDGAAYDTVGEASARDGGPDGEVSVDGGVDVSECARTEASSEPVTIEGQVGSLGGTMEVPAGCAPFPVAVIIGGTGSTDRNGNQEGQGANQQAMLALALRELGVATLRYDDHGIGDSLGAAPPIEDFRFDLEVEDASRWAVLLRGDERFDRVLFAGHSQGSLTGVLASHLVPVDGIISLAGTSLPGGRLLIEQARGNINDDDLEALVAAVSELEAGRTVSTLPPSLASVLPLYVQPYLISWFRFDPLEEVQRVEAPIMVVHGSTDSTVPIDHARMLASAVGSEALIIENMAHSLKFATTTRESQRAAQLDPATPLGTGLAEAIAEFALGLPVP